MAVRAGHITEIYEDGYCRVQATTGERQVYFGRLVILSGGNVVFDTVDQGGATIARHSLPATEIEEAPEEAKVHIPVSEEVTRKRVKVGGRR